MAPHQHGANDPLLDLVFVLDVTGSMTPYIKMAEQKIEYVAQKIFDSKLLVDKEDLRVGLIAYRDYVDGKVTYVHQFTSDMTTVRSWLATYSATGGGDAPEAVATALYDAVDKMNWRPTGARVVVLITDAPPHGIDPFKSYGDDYPNGDPHPVINPLKATYMTKKLVEEKIPVFVVQCEPSMTTYKLGVAYYKGLATKTAGRVFALTNVDLLPDAILAYALETVKMRAVHRSLGGKEMLSPLHKNFAISQRFLALAGAAPSDSAKQDMVAKLYEDPPDNCDDLIDEISKNHTPESALAELKSKYVKDVKCWGITTNVDHTFSEEGKHNVKEFIAAGASGVMPTSLKKDTGTALVGSTGSQNLKLSEGPLKDGQIKRMAHLYVNLYA